MNKEEIMELLRERINSCYQQLLEAKSHKYMKQYVEGYRCRLDELLLTYHLIVAKSFIEVCKEFGIDYKDVTYEPEVKK